MEFSKMQHPGQVIVITLLALGVQGIFLVRALTTGRALVWPRGYATRAGRPKLYWRSVIGGLLGSILCAGAFLWAFYDSLP